MRNEIQIVKGKHQYSETVTLSIYSADISTSIVYRRKWGNANIYEYFLNYQYALFTNVSRNISVLFDNLTSINEDVFKFCAL